MIQLAETAARLIRAQSERIYPDECCGVLLGTVLEDDDRSAAAALPIDNARRDGEAYHRFVIEPEDFLRAELAARARGLDVIGVYHSHPDHPAAPSDYDREHALPFYSYVIVAVAKGKSAELKSYTLSNDRKFMEEEQITWEDSETSSS
ncbi:MAG: M67 family metallopeptidase [Oscillospiraceae bacterium]|jgi:proteasome lid subunit RPN8/RPN11|nr:M67 family metallopeptidase [Oscillospiraceae bacterium]